MKIAKLETKYYVETGGKDDYGMDVGTTHKFDSEEDMIKFLNGENVGNFYYMSYYEYPISVYSKTEYDCTYEYEEDSE